MDMPWKTEPDSWDGEMNGLKVYIRRMKNRSGHLCGYVEVPKDHPLFGKGYNELDGTFEVHGGITFSGEAEMNPDDWAFGFDCAHSWDLTPGQVEGPYPYIREAAGHGLQYRTIDYVKQQLESFSKQLAAVPKPTEESAAFDAFWKSYDRSYNDYQDCRASWTSAIAWLRQKDE